MEDRYSRQPLSYRILFNIDLLEFYDTPTVNGIRV